MAAPVVLSGSIGVGATAHPKSRVLPTRTIIHKVDFHFISEAFDAGGALPVTALPITLSILADADGEPITTDSARVIQSVIYPFTFEARQTSFFSLYPEFVVTQAERALRFKITNPSGALGLHYMIVFAPAGVFGTGSPSGVSGLDFGAGFGGLAPSFGDGGGGGGVNEGGGG